MRASEGWIHMLAAPLPRAMFPRSAHAPRVCPACRSALHREVGVWRCAECPRAYPLVDGIADLRLGPDRYLSLEEEREKAARLSGLSSWRAGESSGLQALARAYYGMTDDVDDRQAARFQAHIARARQRGESLVGLLPTSGRVLEVGCGTGGMLAAAREKGIAIEGVDVATRWLVLARERLRCESSLTAANAEHLPWTDSTFDAIFADSVLEHLDDVGVAMREWHRVARPGARLILVSPNRYSLLPDPHVGIWGLGWLPRRRQIDRVQKSKGCDWRIRLLSARQAARMCELSGWRIHRIEAAPAPHRGLACSIYDAGRRIPPVGAILRRFGPLWLVEAVREGTP